ncbi:MAG: hypothetical protein U0X39_13015 [Bacteroidales bacterium]
MKPSRSIYIIIAFIFTALLFSCEDNVFFINCDDCLADEPERADLIIRIDKTAGSATFYPINLRVYEGNLEDSVLIINTLIRDDFWQYNVMLNKQYTAVASRYISGVKYVTVDSATPRVKYDKSQCENPCYFVYDRKINLKLKYLE